MKRIPLLLLIFCSLFAKAQDKTVIPQWKSLNDGISVSYQGKTPPGYDSLYSYTFLKNVFLINIADTTALKSFSRGLVTQLHITDESTSGTFKWYANGYTANGGTVYPALGGGYWVRQYNGAINPEWFGVKHDGITDDTAPFLLAVKAASGKTILCPAGTYIFTTFYLNGYQNITIKGQEGTTFYKKSGYYGNTPDGAIAGIFTFVNSSNIQFENLEINANKAGALPDTLATYKHLDALDFYICNNINVINCTIRNAEFIGVSYQASNYCNTRNSNFYDCGWGGASFGGGYFSTFGATKCWITNCSFNNIWAGIVSQVMATQIHISGNHFTHSSLIFAQGVDGANIIGNTFNGPATGGSNGESPQDAITIEADNNLIISNNSIVGSARHGIYIQGSYLQNSPQEGLIPCNNIQLIANKIDSSAVQGIEFDPGVPYTYNYTTHTASPASEANYTYANNGIVSNNIITNSGGDGVRIGIASNTKVFNNLVDRSSLNGLFVSSVKNIEVAYNSISNNSTASANTYDGISFDSGVDTLKDISIYDNKSFDDQISHTQRVGFFNSSIKPTNLKMRGNIFDGYSNAVSVTTYEYSDTYTFRGNISANNLSGTNTGDETTARINALYGYTPANGANYIQKAGDSMSGQLNIQYTNAELQIKNDATNTLDFQNVGTESRIKSINLGTGYLPLVFEASSFSFNSNITVTGALKSSGFANVVNTFGVGSTTPNPTHYTILCDATSGSVTVTLPAAGTVTGKIYNIKRVDSTGNTVGITANGSETIDASNTILISAQWKGYTIQSTGSSWIIIGSF